MAPKPAANVNWPARNVFWVNAAIAMTVELLYPWHSDGFWSLTSVVITVVWQWAPSSCLWPYCTSGLAEPRRPSVSTAPPNG